MSNGIPATFAAGCFWGTEHYFKKFFGAALLSHRVGFMGGTELPEVSYELVKGGQSGHAEVLHLTYSPDKVAYRDLLEYFFRIHNSTTLNRQGNDVGSQYRSAIFYHNDEQKREAEHYIEGLNGADGELHKLIVNAFGPEARVVTTVESASRFYPAEEYHQNYLELNPAGYCVHRLYW
ncbi:unnamed protein product [Trypanosoma congolense IL3000]|uniref:peptide-methionine (S)-S-oxide reductase n=1 Tax=Trypanosoma congolense (strain IL3000) TaxID=1068625 RepID=F9WJS4_TRYCI|nr:unnamed protein product [Trypanosoma congolense IL3000]